eukprot:s54_g11.t1
MPYRPQFQLRINHDKRGRKKRQESLVSAQEALQTFQQTQDTKFEALTLMVMSMAHYKFFMYDDMLSDPLSALQIAEELGDKFLTAKALNVAGLAFSSQRKVDEAMEKGKAAMALWRELGLRRQEAVQSHAMAGWLLYGRWPKKALALAEQTLEMLRAIGPAGIPNGAKHRREAMCVYMIIEIMTELKQYKPALKFAKNAFDRFVELDCLLGQGMVKDAMGRVYIVLDKPDKAIEAVDQARAIADTMGDKRWSAKLLFGVAQAHMKAKDINEAVETLDKTIGLAQAAGDMQEILNPKAALRVAKEARSMAQKNGDKRAEAMAVLREAMANGAMGKREEALQTGSQWDVLGILVGFKNLMVERHGWLSKFWSAKQAQEFFQESYWPRGEAQCLHFMADLRSQMGDLDAALENAEERLAVLRSLHDLSMEANAMMQLANLHIKDDNFEEAERLAKEIRRVSTFLLVYGFPGA